MAEHTLHDAGDHTRLALGWASGLGLAVVPWFLAGLVATVVEMLAPERWSPETTFPWLLGIGVVGMLGWLGYGVARIPGFRRGAARGMVLSLAVVVVIWTLEALLEG